MNKKADISMRWSPTGGYWLLANDPGTFEDDVENGFALSP